jgi:hypothetical protein
MDAYFEHPACRFLKQHCQNPDLTHLSPPQFGRRKKKTKAHSQTRIRNPSDVFWRRNLRTGVKTVLVVRIIAKDARTTATEAQLADDIFGTNGDGWNLKSGYDQCSYGQLKFEPLTTHTKVGPDGIYTVSIPNTAVKGVADSKVVNAALAQVTADLGVSPNLLANHVMFCLPPGTSGSWIAYAVINGWKSVYNDVWCQYPSGQMHEFGKSINTCSFFFVCRARVAHPP